MPRFTERQYAEVLQRTRRKSRPEPTTLLPMTEKEFHQQVKDLARMLGWKTYHTLRSKGSDPGFPDLVMLRKGSMIIAELKKEGENPTPEQTKWLKEFSGLQDVLMNPIAIFVCVWRPSDWNTIQKLLR